MMTQQTKKKRLGVNKGVLARIDKLYALLPKINCQGLCHVSCGVIGMEHVEAQRIYNRTGSPPECIGPDYNCSELTQDKQCRVYDIRPLICRAFGVVKGLACPFGCQPERWMSEQAFRILQRRVEALGKGVYITVLNADEFARAVEVYNARQPEGAAYVPAKEQPAVTAQPVQTLKDRIDRVLVQAIIDERK